MSARGVWYTVPMNFEFEGKIFYWGGPAPFLFVAVPEEPSRAINIISTRVSYGWGVIPTHVRIGETEWKTSLFPKDGRYLVPIRLSVQKAENLAVGDSVLIQMGVEAG
jgi:hypothetical protein